MITVGLDFGTHQTKICYEEVESGTTFYKVFRFRDRNGREALTLPSFVRICSNGRLQYGHEALNGVGRAVTYFKQIMFSWTSNEEDRIEAEQWSVLYLAFVILTLDLNLKTTRYIVQMGMPTDANPLHYDYCKFQAVKVMVSAMKLAREYFKDDLQAFLQEPFTNLKALATKCLSSVPCDIREARKRYPIFVFPEAYAALIPLINDHKLPKVGPNLFVDIGGGTVDISFFTSQMEGYMGQHRPYLYYFYSMPCGLNTITGQDLGTSHNVEVAQGQITLQGIAQFRERLDGAVQSMMSVLKARYVEMGRTNVMPFRNFCGQVLDDRPICYSGGGSMFKGLKKEVTSQKGVFYNFSQVTTVSMLINHSGLQVDDRAFHVLATAFALSHHSLINLKDVEPDAIRLLPLEALFVGVRLPQSSLQQNGCGWLTKNHW